MENYAKMIMDRILDRDKSVLRDLDFSTLAELIKLTAKYDTERIHMLYNYFTNIIDRKFYDLNLNCEKLCEIIHAFILSKQITDFDDPIISTAIPVINTVGLDSIAASKRLEIMWSLIHLMNSGSSGKNSRKFHNLLPHVEKLADMKFSEQLKMYHLVYIADINDFYHSVHQKDLFDKYVLSKCNKLRKTIQNFKA